MWLIRIVMLFCAVAIVAVFSLPYITTHYIEKLPDLLATSGFSIESLQATHGITSNQITLGPQQFEIAMGDNILLLDIEFLTVEVDWLDTVINFKPTLSSVRAQINTIRYKFVAVDPNMQITLDDVISALKLSDYFVLANCDINLDSFIFDFAKHDNLVQIDAINLKVRADKNIKLHQLTALVLGEALSIKARQIDDTLIINSKLDTVNFNHIFLRLLNFDSSLELSMGWDIAINLQEYIVQTGRGELNLPWVVFGHSSSPLFDIKFNLHKRILDFELSEKNKLIDIQDRAVIQGNSDFVAGKMVLEIHNVEVGAPYLLALEDAPLAPTLRDQLREFSIQGKLEHGIVVIPFSDVLSASAFATVNEVSMQSVHKNFPGFNDVDVAIQYVNASLFIDIDRDDMQFYFDGFFDEVINLKKVDGIVKINFLPDGVYIDARKILFDTDFLQTPELSLSVRLVPEADIDLINYPSIDLTVKAQQINASKIWSVLPRLDVLNDIVDYIKQAVHGGYGKDITLVLNSGIGEKTGFFIDGKALASDVAVEVDPEWALVEHINASIVMQGEHVSFQNVSAITAGLYVENGTVLIARDQHISTKFPDYTPIWLEGGLHGKLANGINFLQQSPIWVDIEDALEDAIPAGDIDGNFQDLIIYISPDEREAEIAGDVNVNFLNASLEWPQMYIPITNITGTMVYSGDKPMKSSNLRGDFYGNEMIIDLHGDLPVTQDFAKHIVTARSTIQAQTASYWMDDWNKFMEGSTDFLMTFEIISHHSWVPTIDIETDFSGMHFYLPIPFGKKPEQLRPTTFKLLVEESNEEKVRFWFDSKEVCGDVWAGDFGITGDIFLHNKVLCTEAQQHTPSIKVASVRGQLPFADASSWMDFIRETPVDPLPVPLDEIIDFDIDIDIPEIAITSMIVKNTNLKVTSDDMAIYVSGKGQHFQGNATIPSDKSIRAIGEMSLNLTNIAATPEQWSWIEDPRVPKWTTFDPDNLQPFDITINDLGSNNTRLGSAKIYTVHRPQEVDVFLDINSSELTLAHSQGEAAKLTWKLYDNQLTTGIDVSLGLKGKKFKRLLQDIGLDEYFHFQQLDYEANLIWEGDVTDISLDSLEGDLKFNSQDLFLGKKVTKDVALPGIIALQVTRFLDIFSVLGSLFTLNFKDLQWQNISQSLLKFQFSPHKIHIENVIIETSHIISARGTIDEIYSKDYDKSEIDLSVFIRPNVSSSLPLLWASACGAPCLLAILLVDQFVSINDESTIGVKLFGKTNDIKVLELVNRIDSGDDWLDATSREVFIEPPLLPEDGQ